eukprot:g83167.t1
MHPKFKTWSYSSLHHKAKCLLGVSTGSLPHHPVTDAVLSIHLYMLHQQLQLFPQEMARAQYALLSSPVESSFAKENATYDKVCMGNKKTCKCGAPFFF